MSVIENLRHSLGRQMWFTSQGGPNESHRTDTESLILSLGNLLSVQC